MPPKLSKLYRKTACFSCVNIAFILCLKLRLTELQALTPISTINKVIFFSLISILGTALYLFSLHSTRPVAAIIPATAVDDFVPFVPWFIAAYLSFFAFLPLPLFFIRDLEEFIPAAFGFLFIMVVSNVIFLIWPTSIPPGGPYDPLLHGLLTVDRDRNACPSLHVSLALYCSLCVNRHISKPLFRIALWSWALLIMASPLLIKRHMFIDVVAGGALAAIVYFVALPIVAARYRQFAQS